MEYAQGVAWETKLRVVIVHSRYSSRQSSGENLAVDRQAQVLRRAGFAVRVVEQRTDDREQRLLYKAEAALAVATGVGPSPIRDIWRFQPDIVHVHNLFPNWGTSWLSKTDVPIVATLHNYRPLCPAGTFFRNGQTCTDCVESGSTRPALQHACYRGSRLKTLPLALGKHFADHPVLANSDRLIVLHETMRNLYLAAGVPNDKLSVLGNFAPEYGAGNGEGEYFLYVGRLTPEKGLLRALADWPLGRRLLIVGDGPERAQIARAAPAGVELLGEQPVSVVADLMRRATGLLFPSRWFEGFPLVYAEALAAGTPVLAWDPSAVAKMVEADGTGLRVEGTLSTALEQAEQIFPELRRRCREVYEERYTESAWLNQVSALYRDVIYERRRDGGS